MKSKLKKIQKLALALMMMSSVPAFADWASSGLGKAVQFGSDGGASVGDLFLVIALCSGVVIVVVQLIGKFSNRQSENFARNCVIGVVLCAVGAGGLGALVNDSGLTEGATGFQQIQFYNGGNAAGGNAAGGTP